jgi:hypothetical protein
MATPAQAVFGLSACEKVKKQVLEYEKQINGIVSYWYAYKGKKIPSSLVSKFNKQVLGGNDVVQQLTKFEYNNPKCFTRTQNEEIQGRKTSDWNMTQFVKYDKDNILRTTKKCQDFWEKLQPSQECLIRTDITITDGFTIPSIYNS